MRVGLAREAGKGFPCSTYSKNAGYLLETRTGEVTECIGASSSPEN